MNFEEEEKKGDNPEDDAIVETTPQEDDDAIVGYVPAVKKEKSSDKPNSMFPKGLPSLGKKD